MLVVKIGIHMLESGDGNGSVMVRNGSTIRKDKRKVVSLIKEKEYLDEKEIFRNIHDCLFNSGLHYVLLDMVLGIFYYAVWG